jgi:hypothetical protein
MSISFYPVEFPVLRISRKPLPSHSGNQPENPVTQNRAQNYYYPCACMSRILFCTTQSRIILKEQSQLLLPQPFIHAQVRSSPPIADTSDVPEKRLYTVPIKKGDPQTTSCHKKR